MKRLFVFLVIVYSFNTSGQELTWLTDFDEAKKQANIEDKQILMRFTGSDWCANCVRIDTVLIEQPSFIEFAKDRYIFLYLDFPSKPENALSPTQTKHNQKLLEKYNPAKAFPALLILDPKGKTLGQMNVRPNTTEVYIKLLREIEY